MPPRRAALLLLAAAAAAARAPAPPAYHLLVVRDDCWKPFFVDLAWLSPAAWAAPGSPLRDCAAASVSKALGYGIIAGSLLVKLPQVANILRARSPAGLSLASQYQELASNLLAVVWHVSWNRSPFSAYGETIIVTLGCALVIATMWAFERPSLTHLAGAGAAAAALGALVFAPPAAAAAAAGALARTAGLPAPPASLLKDALQLLSQLTFWASRATQLVDTQRARSNGAQSPLTLAFNLAGTAARVFTSMREVKDPLQLAFTVVNVALNGALCVQWWAFRAAAVVAPQRAARRAAAAKPAAARAKSPAPAPEAAPAPRAKSGGSARARSAAKRK
jgi:mannose-P-dolichol utilization defect protein 1